jgi:hypothetical protein
MPVAEATVTIPRFPVVLTEDVVLATEAERVVVVRSVCPKAGAPMNSKLKSRTAFASFLVVFMVG